MAINKSENSKPIYTKKLRQSNLQKYLKPNSSAKSFQRQKF